MMKLKLLCIAVLAVLLFGCFSTGAGGTCPAGTSPTAGGGCAPSFWGSWESIALTGILALFLFIALLYMIAEGFEFQHLRPMLRDELVQIAISAVFVVMLAAFIWSMQNSLLPVFAATVGITPGELASMPADCQASFSGTSFDPYIFAQKCYTNQMLGAKFAPLSNTIQKLAIEVGRISSVTTYCQLLGGTLGFAITPCRYLGSTQGTLGLSLTAINSAIIAMQAQSFLLSLAQSFLVFLLPIGILLRCIRATRGAGGAMIAIAIGFYFVYPLMVLVDYSMIKDSALVSTGAYYYDSATPSTNKLVVPPPPKSIMGTCIKDQEYINGLLNKQNFIEPLAYWVIIIAILLPVMNLLVTLTFIRWFSSVMSSDIEVSQLARVT